MDRNELEADDFELSPFDHLGGFGKAYQWFGDGKIDIINNLNQTLVA
jgi:hypothetical protein